MKIVRRKGGVIAVDGKVTTFTVVRARYQSEFDVSDGENYLFSCRSLWAAMNALTVIITAFGASRSLLKRARDEMWDWQYVLCGEREGLDELCSEIDVALGSAPVIPWQAKP